MSTITATNLHGDTIRKTGGSLGVDIRVKNNSVYESDGGTSVTQNLVQGLAKAFNHFDGTSDTIRDSLNASSVTDVGTGQYKQIYTNNMNAQFFMVTTNAYRDSDQYIGNRYSDNATTHHQVNCLNNNTANRADTNTAISVIHGDLA